MNFFMVLFGSAYDYGCANGNIFYTLRVDDENNTKLTKDTKGGK